MENIQLYLYDISRPFKQREIDLLPPERVRYAQSYRFEQDRARCMAAGLLLSVFLGVSSGDMLFSGEYGKPMLKDADGVYFNLSHAGQYAILAVAPSEVGADIEAIRPFADDVAQKCFTQEEYQWMKEQKNDEAFYTLWTAKESIMKSTGKGFAMPPEHFCVLPVDGSAHIIEGRTWFLNWLQYEGHMACVALENQNRPIHTIQYR